MSTPGDGAGVMAAVPATGHVVVASCGEEVMFLHV